MGLTRYSANARLLSGAAMGLVMVAGAVPAVAQENDTPEAEGEGNQAMDESAGQGLHKERRSLSSVRRGSHGLLSRART